MGKGNNVNVYADEKDSLNPNDNDNVKGAKYARSRRVDEIADEIERKLGTKGWRAFYCKIAWKLPEHRIWSNLEIALETSKKGTGHAGKIFSHLCKKDGV